MKNEMLKCLWCGLLAAIMLACTRSENPPVVDTNNNGSTTIKKSIYSEIDDLHLGVFSKYLYTDMHLFLDSPEEHTFSKNTEPRSYVFGSSYTQKLTITDSCSISGVGIETIFKLSRQLEIDDYSTVLQFRTPMYIGTPIVFLQPLATLSDPIPTCYYDGLRLEWNADLTNVNGVQVVVEWHGTTVFDKPENRHITNQAVLKDTGSAVLDNHLFDDIPNAALVNIWLFRANFCPANPNYRPDEIDDFVKEVAINEGYSQKEVRCLKSIIRTDPVPLMSTGSIALLPIILLRD